MLKKYLVLAASFGASIQIVKHTVNRNAWQSVDSFTFTGSNDRRILTNYIIREEGENALFKCTICGHVNALKTNVLNHVESIHFPNTFQYSCDICGKTTKSKQSLYKHVSVNHRQGKMASTWNKIPWIVTFRKLKIVEHEMSNIELQLKHVYYLSK